MYPTIKTIMSEKHLHQQICTYIKYQFPSVIFFSEPSGLRVSIGQAVMLKKLRSFGKLPDLFICKKMGQFGGLFIEIKAVNIYRKDGTLLKNEHLLRQKETLDRLNAEGYMAVFGIGFENCKLLIDNYLKL